MKSIATLVVVAILAASLQVTHAVDCTDQLCTATVSVTQQFTGPNCTGNFTLVVGTNYTQRCEQQFNPGWNSSTSYQCDQNSLATLTYDNLQCAGKPSKYLNPIGLCQSSGAVSYASWCNRESVGTPKAYPSPSTDVPVLPKYSGASCSATTGCSEKLGTLYLYSAAGCPTSSIQEVAPPSAYLSGDAMEFGICYVNNRTDGNYDNRLNFRATCANGYYSYGATVGCGSSAPGVGGFSFPTDTCIQVDVGQWTKITCKGSGAGVLSASSLFAFLILAIALIF